MDIVLVVHLLSAVFWIGGVGFATMALFPAIHELGDSMEKVRLFMGVEKRFSRLAKVYVGVTGITGIVLFMNRGGLDWALANPVQHMMLAFKVLVWLVFVLLLFGAEKRLMKSLISQQTAPEKAFKRMQVFHWVMVSLAATAIAFGSIL